MHTNLPFTFPHCSSIWADWEANWSAPSCACSLVPAAAHHHRTHNRRGCCWCRFRRHRCRCLRWSRMDRYRSLLRAPVDYPLDAAEPATWRRSECPVDETALLTNTGLTKTFTYISVKVSLLIRTRCRWCQADGQHECGQGGCNPKHLWQSRGVRHFCNWLTAGGELSWEGFFLCERL